MKYLILLIALLSSCQTSKKHSNIIFEKFKEFDANKNIRNSGEIIGTPDNSIADIKDEYYSNKKLFKISTFLLDRPYGHYFVFRPSGELSKYFFGAGDSIHSTYEISYNFKNQSLQEMGCAYVDYMENVNADTSLKKYSLLFSYFPRQKLEISISSDSINFKAVQLHNSNFMPLLGEYDYEAKKGEKYIYLKVSASNPLIELQGLSNATTSIRKINF